MSERISVRKFDEPAVRPIWVEFGSLKVANCNIEGRNACNTAIFIGNGDTAIDELSIDNLCTIRDLINKFLSEAEK